MTRRRSIKRRVGKYALVGMVIALGVLITDSGLGYVLEGDTTPQLIALERDAGAPNRLFVLFHGYNGSGTTLVDILGPHLRPYGDVVAFQSNGNGYNNGQVLDAAQKIIKERQPSQVVLYGESFGGMVAMDLLRRSPSLKPEAIVFNATPSRVGNVNPGIFLRPLDTPLAAILRGGPITTALLRLNKKRELNNVPTSEAGVDEAARQRAYDEMRRVTGRRTSDEARYMAGFISTRPGEFAGRSDTVRYLHAPDEEPDPLIDTTASSAEIHTAFSGTVFHDVSVSNWKGLHAPTPERPSSLAEQLITATN